MLHASASLPSNTRCCRLCLASWQPMPTALSSGMLGATCTFITPIMPSMRCKHPATPAYGRALDIPLELILAFIPSSGRASYRRLKEIPAPRRGSPQSAALRAAVRGTVVRGTVVRGSRVPINRCNPQPFPARGSFS